MHVLAIYINQFASRGGRKLGGKERHPEEDDEGGDEKDADDADDDDDDDDDDDHDDDHDHDDDTVGDQVGMVKAFQNQNACIAAWQGPGIAAWLVVMRAVRAEVVLVLFGQEHLVSANLVTDRLLVVRYPVWIQCCIGSRTNTFDYTDLTI